MFGMEVAFDGGFGHWRMFEWDLQVKPGKVARKPDLMAWCRVGSVGLKGQHGRNAFELLW